jgi:ATP-dependent DNA helicase RecQ
LVELRESATEAPSRAKRPARLSAVAKAPVQLGSEALLRYAALKAWRAEVAKEHNLPAYVIFHDATLAAIAERHPQTLDELQGISGLGAKKLEAYGEAVLRVVTAT